MRQYNEQGEIAISLVMRVYLSHLMLALCLHSHSHIAASLDSENESNEIWTRWREVTYNLCKCQRRWITGNRSLIRRKGAQASEDEKKKEQVKCEGERKQEEERERGKKATKNACPVAVFQV